MMKRVLVVDDEPGMRITLAASLELEGFDVVEADSGAQALGLIRDEPFDLVITDIRMPGLDGVQTLTEIRKIRPETVIIMMTGYTQEKRLSQGIAEGAYTILEKPFGMESAMRVFHRALGTPTVLIVDDVPNYAESIAVPLRAIGLRVEVVHDGPSALRVLDQMEVDICVIDLVMPQMDGVATSKLLLETNKSLRIIGMTGYPVEDMISHLAILGGYACLRKPFAIPALVEMIARARAVA